MRSLRSGVLLQILHVVGGVPPLEEGVRSRALLLALPEKVSAKRLGKLGRKHVAAGGAWRVRHGLRVRWLHDDGFGPGNVRATHGEVFVFIFRGRGGNGGTIG